MQERGDRLQRLFLAVRLSRPVVLALEELPRTGEAGVRWVAPEQWHITPRFFANAAAVDVIAAMSSVMPPPAIAVRSALRSSLTRRPTVSGPTARDRIQARPQK